MTKKDLFKYKGVVKKHKDGDTFILQADLGFKIFHDVNVRFARIDAPNDKSLDPVIKVAGEEATQYVNDLLQIGLTLWIDSKKYDKYGRSVSEVYFDLKGKADMTKAISDIIVEAGHARYEKY